MLEPAQGPEEQLRRVRDAARPMIDEGKFLLTLGGEHSITTPLVQLLASATARSACSRSTLTRPSG